MTKLGHILSAIAAGLMVTTSISSAQDLAELEAAAKEAGTEISAFVRLEVGEGIEKKEEDFAAEVAKVAQG